jgi:hypothetical protein
MNEPELPLYAANISAPKLPDLAAIPDLIRFRTST